MNKVKHFRKMIRLSQWDMAMILEISQASYCRKEQGEVPFLDAEKHAITAIINRNGYPDLRIDDVFQKGKTHRTESSVENRLRKLNEIINDDSIIGGRINE